MTQTIRKVDRGIYFEWINSIGLRHNEDGPAVEYKGGQYKDWQINGEYHRLGAPARIWASGMEEWYFNGKLHREDGPAAEYTNGAKYWFVNGKRHREDGPAVIDGSYQEWWYNGEFFPDINTNAEFIRIVKLKAFL